MRVGISLTSSTKVSKKYIDLTNDLGSSLAKINHGIVYGGTDYGMMETLAKSYKNSGGTDLVGVIAEDLMKVTKGYKAYKNLDKKYFVPSIYVVPSTSLGISVRIHSLRAAGLGILH